MKTKIKIAVIGCGVMGSALATHFSKETQVVLYDKNREKTVLLSTKLGCKSAKTAPEAIQSSDIVLLAIKPKDLHIFANATKEYFSKRQWLISILAATQLGLLEKTFPIPTIIRAVPNLPLICGKGIIGFVETAQTTKEQKEKITRLFHSLGLLTWLSEDHLNILSAFTGSGPAFIFLLIEALTEGGVFLGLSYQEALSFVLEVIEGSTALLKSTQEHPAILKTKISSPGGTTIAGLKVLEETGVRGILINALIATYQKAKEIQKNQQM
jgi:pyrroline-5-carboxylate reductase